MRIAASLLILVAHALADNAANGAELGRTHAQAPNVLLAITDDQGYGDFSLHGNPILQTPHLDAFARQSQQFSSFYVSPV